MSVASRWSLALALAAARGVPPAAFWRLSIAEWRALSGPETSAPLSRADLDSLMKNHPDS